MFLVGPNAQKEGERSLSGAEGGFAGRRLPRSISVRSQVAGKVADVGVLDSARATSVCEERRDFILFEPLDDVVRDGGAIVVVVPRGMGRDLQQAQVYLASSLARWLTEQKVDGAGRRARRDSSCRLCVGRANPVAVGTTVLSALPLRPTLPTTPPNPFRPSCHGLPPCSPLLSARGSPLAITPLLRVGGPTARAPLCTGRMGRPRMRIPHCANASRALRSKRYSALASLDAMCALPWCCGIVRGWSLGDGLWSCVVLCVVCGHILQPSSILILASGKYSSQGEVL